jgi:hypothetical protein
MSAGTSNITLPEMEHVGELLARLYPKRAELDPSAHRLGGHLIAAAIGLYAQDRPHRRFPALLLMARCWPDGVTVAQRTAMVAITADVLRRRTPTTAMPRRARATVDTVLASGKLARELLTEFSAPPPCWKCQGRGEVARGALLLVCPQCSGFAEGPRGTPTRAASIAVTRSTWCTYLQRPYERTLHGFRFMADHAAHGVLGKL